MVGRPAKTTEARKALIDNAIAALEAVAGELGETGVVFGSASKPSALEADTFIGLNILQASERREANEMLDPFAGGRNLYRRALPLRDFNA